MNEQDQADTEKYGPNGTIEVQAIFSQAPAPEAYTPLPWHFSRKFKYVSDINHRVVAEIAPLHGFRANAALIVRAVNSHAELVASLEEMMGVYWGAGDGELPEPGCILRARAALAAAKATL